MKKIIALGLVLLLIFSNVMTAAAFLWTEFEQLMIMQQTISHETLYEDVDGEYLFAVALREILNQHPELYEMAARAMLATIDENSFFRNREETREFWQSLEGEFGGIGVHVLQTPQGLLITGIIADSAAHIGGLLVDDIIIEVDGESLMGLMQEQSVGLVRGEIGTEVQLLIRRANVEEPLEFILTRRIVGDVPVEYTILEDYGVIHLWVRTFNSRTDIYVEAALAAAYEAGITKVLLDLRNNTGGLLDEAIALAERFVYGERLIVTQSFRDSYNTFYSNLIDREYDVVVLVNGNTASGSEVVAGAIQDHEIGPIVGTQTFGKATVQSFRQMLWGDSIVHTVAQYLTPSGELIHGRGIFPDVWVNNIDERFDFITFGNFTYDRTYRIGDSGADVARARAALDILGIHIRDAQSSYFDNELQYAILEFQRRSEIYQSGELCPHTAVTIFIRLQNTYITRDVQFERGLQILLGEDE